MTLNKKATIDPIHLIVGIMLILGGALYMINLNNWGLIVASIGLLIGVIRQVVR